MQLVAHKLLNLQKNIKPAFRVWIFLISLLITCAFSTNAHGYTTLSDPAYSIEEVQSGKQYVDTFTIYNVDILGNRSSTTYGIKLETAKGVSTSSLESVITSYESDNFKITTSAVSGAQSFTTNGITYYITNTNGGAIAKTNNYNVTSDKLFVGNSNQNGGAIYNPSSITADFIGNTGTYGGAVNSQNNAGTISGNFIGNGKTSSHGGAIINRLYRLTAINAVFIGNVGNPGGAINNYGNITDINSTFIGNSASNGGAIYNYSGILYNINSSFIGNSATSNGGAIFLYGGSIGVIVSDFISNVAGGNGGAINANVHNITSITGDFLSNKATNGGAIYTGGTITSLKANFTANSATATGGAITNSGTITNGITGGFYANTAGGNGGAIWNSGTIGDIVGDFMSNTSGGYGGAIWNNNGGTLGTISGSFMGNTSAYLGGAIYSNQSLIFSADGKSHFFSDNKDSSGYNAIYLASGANQLDFNMNNKGEFVMNDSIQAAGALTMNIKGDSVGFGASTFYLNDMITTGLSGSGGLTINVDSANLFIGAYTHRDGTTTSGLGMTSGIINLTDADLIVNLKGYKSGDSILDGVTLDNSSGSSDLWVYNVASGTYEFGNDNLNNGWTDDLIFTANSLQTVTITPDQLIVGYVATSDHFTGPLKDIIKETVDSGNFCSSTASAGMDFICGATNVFVGDVVQQQAVIESAAQMASIPGVNANTIIANRATRQAIKMRQMANTEDLASDVVIYDANGKIVYDESEKHQPANPTGFMEWLLHENNMTSSWFAPITNQESVKNMQAGKFDASYNSTFYGANLGIDRTFGSSFRLGIALAAGAGSTIATGDFQGIENKFTFVTLSAYESLNVEDFTLNANFSYTRKFNNLTQDLSRYLMDSLYTSANSYLWLLELHAERDFEITSKYGIINKTSFIPYLGLELMQVKTQDYDVYVDKSETNTSVGDIVFNVSTDAQNLAIIPLGIKFNKRFDKEVGEEKNLWTLLPEVEIGALFTLGDLYDKTITGMPGVESTASFNLEVFDKVTYNAGLGFTLISDECEIGLDYNMLASPNRFGYAVLLKGAYNF